MTIKIVLPDGKDVKTPIGTRVFTHEGYEIENIEEIEILPMRVDSIIQAKITVAVDSIENLEGVVCNLGGLIKEMPIEFIESELLEIGYKVVKVD